MTGQENRINDALRALGEEHRMGMVSGEEYRARRRGLLESWGERDVTTSPTGIARRTGTTTGSRTAPNPASAARVAKSAGKSRAGPAVTAAIVVIGLAAAYLFGYPRAAPEPVAAPVAQPPPPRNAALRAVVASAGEFLKRNRWEQADLDLFAADWAALPSTERTVALQEPALKLLRHELEQNIQTERQALAPDADAGQRQRLERLMQFARQLDGEAL